MAAQGPQSWGKAADPVSVMGLHELEQHQEEDMGEEGQGIFPELADFYKSMGNPEGAPERSVKFKRVKYDYFNLMVPEHKDRLETLTTRLANGEGCVICREEATFTKEGHYIVIIKWAEYELVDPTPVSSSDAES